MLSSKYDRLRDRAHELRMFADGLSAPYIVPSTKETIGISMQSAATELERAADTIWELRRKLVHVVDQSEEVERLKAENAKLRDMLGKYIRQAHLLAYDKGNPLTVGIIEEDARELGIEVE